MFDWGLAQHQLDDVKIIRAEFQETGAPDLADEEPTREVQNADATLVA